MIVGFKVSLNRLNKTFHSHTTSLAPKEVAMYYASVELSATEDCFLLNQEIIPDPRLKQHPEVLLRFVELPVQSEFEKS